MKGREPAIRAALTAAVLGLLVLVLALADYDWNFAQIWGFRDDFAKGFVQTLLATGLAYVLGLVLGVVVAVARLSRNLVARHLGDLYVEFVRGTPFLVQVFIAYFGIAPLLGVDNRLFVGVLALGVFAAAYIGEIFRAGIESVERGQVEAARSLGLSRLQCLRHVVFPQAFKRMIPPLTGELIALTKESSLLFAIGVTEITYAAKTAGAATYKHFEAYLVVAVLYLAITIPLSLLARRLERRLGRSERLGEHL